MPLFHLSTKQGKRPIGILASLPFEKGHKSVKNCLLSLKKIMILPVNYHLKRLNLRRFTIDNEVLLWFERDLLGFNKDSEPVMFTA